VDEYITFKRISRDLESLGHEVDGLSGCKETMGGNNLRPVVSITCLHRDDVSDVDECSALLAVEGVVYPGGPGLVFRRSAETGRVLSIERNALFGRDGHVNHCRKRVREALSYPFPISVRPGDSPSQNRFFDRFHPMPDIVHIDAA